MEDPEEKPRPRMRWPFYVALFVVFLPVLYVLSTGPAIWLLVNGYVSEENLRPIYAPIGWLEVMFPKFSNALLWYIQLWVEKLPP